MRHCSDRRSLVMGHEHIMCYFCKKNMGWLCSALFVLFMGVLSHDAGSSSQNNLPGRQWVEDNMSDRPEALSDTLLVGSGDFFGSPHLLEPEGGLQALPRSGPGKTDWLTVVFILCLGCIAVARFFFPGRIRYIMKAGIGLRFFHMVEKEALLFRETPAYLLAVNFLLLISLLTYQSLVYLDMPPGLQHHHPGLIFSVFFLFFLLFYLLKRLLVGFLAWVFASQRAAKLYFSNLWVFNLITGVLLIPIVFFQVYNQDKYALYAGWILLIIINIYKISRGGMLAYRASGYSVYYLILYLCAVEIAPLLIIGKTASLYLFNYQ